MSISLIGLSVSLSQEGRLYQRNVLSSSSIFSLNSEPEASLVLRFYIMILQYYRSLLCLLSEGWILCHIRGSRGGDRGSGLTPTPKKSQNIGFLSNLLQISRKITKLPGQHSMLGHHQHACETPFKWRFAGGPMIARL